MLSSIAVSMLSLVVARLIPTIPPLTPVLQKGA